MVRALTVHIGATLLLHTLPLLLGVLGLRCAHLLLLVLGGLWILAGRRVSHLLLRHTARHLRRLQIPLRLLALSSRLLLLLEHHLLLLIRHVRLRVGGLVRVCGRHRAYRLGVLAVKAREELLTVVVGVVAGVHGDGELHLGCNNQVIAILHTHLGEGFRLARDRLFPLDVDVHLLLLDELTQFGVLHLAEDDVLEDLEALVRAYLDLEGLVQFVVKIGRLDGNVQVKRPRLLLTVRPRMLSGHAVHTVAVARVAHHHLLVAVLDAGNHLAVVRHRLLLLEDLLLLLHRLLRVHVLHVLLLVHVLRLLLLRLRLLLHLVLLGVAGRDLRVAALLHHRLLLLQLVLLHHLLVALLLLLHVLLVVLHTTGFRGSDVFG